MEDNNRNLNASEEGGRVEDGEDIITMPEVIAAQEEEEELAAQIPTGDPTRCTYQDGYLKSQPVMICLTCFKTTGKWAGICFGCGERCHPNHEVIEIWEKRNFRCDCGNKNFPEPTPCKFEPVKDDTNEQNKYNHNFEGKFCYCDQLEDTSKESIQCYTCQDWFHADCITEESPEEESEQFICKLCAEAYPFLYFLTQETSSSTSTSSEPPSETSSSSSSLDTTPPTTCRLKKASSSSSLPSSFPNLLLKSDWQQRLCRCSECLTLYHTKNVEYLLELPPPSSSSVSSGTSVQGGRKRKSLHDAGVEAMSTLPRVAQLEYTYAFEDLKTRFKNFVEGFATSGRVVTKADIDGFFGTLPAKRPRH